MAQNGTIIVTGGAGFIGSNLIAALQERGYGNIAVCDRFRSGEKWKNLAQRELADIIPPENLLAWLEKTPQISAIFHLGAISATTETDVDKLMATNFSLSLALWQWCAKSGVPFIYASSAATYGAGSQGFRDDTSLEYLSSLRPLNPYGWSKNLFDMRCARAVQEGKDAPPQWVGLKFFNVYGPNEYHKGAQKSVLCHMFPRAKKNLAVRLFKSHNKKFKDGGQRRDFIYVKDCCDVMVWFLEHPEKSGLYNVGTGAARTFNDTAKALFASLGKKSRIEYISMPREVARHYQYHTEADLSRLRHAGYTAPFTSLEEGINEYVTRFLDTDNPYR